MGALGAAAGFAFGALVEKMQFGPPLVMVALGGMTLALAGLALWRMIDPLTREGQTAAAAPRRSGRVRELEREKQLVLKAIKEVELDYQMRKIAEHDYREMVERYRARALRLIGELEAGDDFRSLIERELAMRLKLGGTGGEAGQTTAASESPSVSPETPTRVERSPRCSACATPNDDDAQFCKKCGAKL